MEVKSPLQCQIMTTLYIFRVPLRDLKLMTASELNYSFIRDRTDLLPTKTSSDQLRVNQKNSVLNKIKRDRRSLEAQYVETYNIVIYKFNTQTNQTKSARPRINLALIQD